MMNTKTYPIFGDLFEAALERKSLNEQRIVEAFMDTRKLELLMALICFTHFPSTRPEYVYRSIQQMMQARIEDFTVEDARCLAAVGWVLNTPGLLERAMENGIRRRHIYSLWKLSQGLPSRIRLNITRQAIKLSGTEGTVMRRRAFVRNQVANCKQEEKKEVARATLSPEIAEKIKNLSGLNGNIGELARAFVAKHYENAFAAKEGKRRPSQAWLHYLPEGGARLTIAVDAQDAVFLADTIGAAMRRTPPKKNESYAQRMARSFFNILLDKVHLNVDMFIAGTLSSWLGLDMAHRMVTSGPGLFNPEGITDLLARYGKNAQLRSAIAITNEDGSQLIDYAQGRIAPKWMRDILAALAGGVEDNTRSADIMPLSMAQVHHMKPYAQGGPTSLSNSMLLSPSAHGQFSRKEYGEAVRDMETWDVSLVKPDGTVIPMENCRKPYGMLRQLQKEASEIAQHYPDSEQAIEQLTFRIMRQYIKTTKHCIALAAQAAANREKVAVVDTGSADTEGRSDEAVP